MTGEVRLSQKRKTGDAARSREAVPHLFTNDLQVQITDNAIKHVTQRIRIAQSFRSASGRVNQPFCANDHVAAQDRIKSLNLQCL